MKASLGKSRKIEKDYLDELAYTVMVVKGAGIHVEAAALMLLSDDYRHGDAPEQLFVTVDKTEEARARAAELLSRGESIDLALGDQPPEPRLTRACRNCEFFDTACLGSRHAHTVLELPRLHETKLKSLAADNIVGLADVPDDFELTPTQQRVKTAIDRGTIVIEPGIKEALDEIEWPCHYLDFETVTTALPLYPKQGCHEQVVTQFSVHRTERLDDRPDNSGFLAEAHENQERLLAERLIKTLGTSGSIIVYSPFENTQINRLIKKFPDLAAPLGKIESRLCDFEKLVRSHVYDPDFRGSFSLKRVVPALVPDTTYDGLAIQDGDAAMSEFARMARGEIADVARTRQNLLEYCKQDTLVMVRLHQALTRLAGTGPGAKRNRKEGEANRSKENGQGRGAKPDGEPSTEATAERPAGSGPPPQTENAEGTEREKIKNEIGKARKELLDLSLRNPLLNFRESKSRGIRIVGRTAKEVFSTLVRKRRAMTVTAQEEEAAPETALATKRKPESAGRKRSGQPARGTRKEKLETPYQSSGLETRLRNTLRFAEASLEEQGVNILYVALGMLRWHEAEASREARCAPLILAPARLEHERAGNSFTLRFAEEEIAANLSLDQKLRQDFGIRLPTVVDGEDLDIEKHFDEVEACVGEQKGWSVDRSSVHAGFFSFNKLLIYKDLDPAAWPAEEGPAAHPVMRSLFGTEGFNEPYDSIGDDECVDDHLDMANTHQVLDADSSQTLALIDAKNGHNLVIQGPPGTGKSQTITNLIAEAIADERTVLFVAEKMAALEVVKHRLDAAEIGDACLELHSQKASKRAVLEELRRTHELKRPDVSDPAEHREILSNDRKRLNAYCRAVNTPIGNSGMSLHEIVGRLAEEETDSEAAAIEKAANWTKADFAKHAERVAEFSSRVSALGDPREHTFEISGRCRLGPSEARKVGAAIGNAAKSGRDLLATLEKLRGLTRERRTADSHNEVARLTATLERAAEAPDLSSLNHRHTAWLEKSETLGTTIRAHKRLKALHEEYDTVLTSKAWKTPVQPYRRGIEKWGPRWLRRLRQEYRTAYEALRQICVTVPSEGRAQLALIDAILEAQRLEHALQKQARLLAGVSTKPESDSKNRAPIARETARWLKALHTDKAAGKVEPWIHAILDQGFEKAELEQYANEARQGLKAFDEAVDAAREELEVRTNTTDGRHPLEREELSAATTWLHKAYDNRESLHDMVRFNLQAERLAEDGMEKLVEWAVASPEKAAELSRQLEGGWLNALMEKAFDEHPEIAEFDGTKHERVIERFRTLDSNMFQHNRARVAQAHWERMPRQGGGPAMRLLLREFVKKRRHLPLRRLLTEAGETVLRIKPVFMMSPLSIAKFIAPGTLKFDLVIFDEASQVRPIDALGAIIRGKQTIVVGDNKQLPPTRFFDAAGDESDEEEETSWAADVESILGLFRANGAPERMLRWHYRSQHESLIATSNQEFYDNRLMLFPSPDAGRESSGLHLRLHPETSYERGKRVNSGEAAKIADAVMEHAHREPELTLGVAAFSTPQARRIEDEVELRRRSDPSGEEFFASHPEKRFFIKNLENIQGDERDVMMISIGYGRIAGGYLPMNFGPLNQDGGERRLNVLITRARQRMEVHSNFGAAELDLTRTKARGVQSLKTFLQYAATGILESAERSGKEADSPFEEAVAERLRAEGHRIEHQIGSAGFFIDLAVVDPQEPGRYVLGIECDGATYHSARSARDRDRLRQEVLENLGWKIHRIWSTDWFRNPGREIESVNKSIHAAAVAYGPVRRD